MSVTNQEMTSRTIIKVAPNQMSCDLAGEAAILNLQSGVYFGLDAVGARIWELLQQPTDVARIRDELLQEYEVEADVLEADIKALIGQMAQHGLVQFEEPDAA